MTLKPECFQKEKHLHQILLKCSFGLLSTCPKKNNSKQQGYAEFSGKPISWWLWKYVYIYVYVCMYLNTYIYIYILPTLRVFFFLLTSQGLQPGSFQVKFVCLENSQFSQAEMIFSPILNPTILDCERCNPDFFPPALENAMFTKKR